MKKKNKKQSSDDLKCSVIQIMWWDVIKPTLTILAATKLELASKARLSP